MNKKKLLGKTLPHLIAVFVFLLVAVVYCRPVFSGKVLVQEDVLNWQGISHNSFQYKETHGHFPLWTNGLYSGMPTYQIAMDAYSLDVVNITLKVLTLWLKKPLSFFFLACICFYFLTRVLRTNAYVGIIGSLAYAYATYNAVIIAVGHDTKMLDIALIPGLIGSLILLFEKRYWLGAALTTLFAALLVAAGHMQIVYYAAIIAVGLFMGYAVRWIRGKEYRHLLLAGTFAASCAVVGMLNNAVILFTSYDSTKESTRGGSELADAVGKTASNGLSDNAAFDFSMNKAEPFVLLVPHIYGGSSGDEIPKEASKAQKALAKMPSQAAVPLAETLRYYWGGSADVSGPPYAGAIICFLAIIGFFILDNKHKWWILATGLLTILMSWGGNFQAFNSYLLKVLPMYNKFRAPSMILVVPTFLLCMLAVLTLQKILASGKSEALWKRYRWGLLSTAGIFGILFLLYLHFDYTSATDKELLRQAGSQHTVGAGYIRTYLQGLKEDRQGLFLGSLLRSFLFILAAALPLGWYMRRGNMRPALLLGLVGALTFVDVMAMDIRYLNDDNYQEKKEYQLNFAASPADTEILKDSSFYRVLDLRDGDSNTLSYGAMTAWFHHSIGGYHAAKLKIYEDLINYQLYNFPECMPVINMLNTKYIIRKTAAGADSVCLNSNNLGAVWFVRNFRYEASPHAVMNALNHFHPKDTAVLFAADRSQAPDLPQPDTMATIRLIKNDNDIVSYLSDSRTERFAVFSEIFYDRGWKAYVDDDPHARPIIRTNYVLRGLKVPPGHHIIRFVFHPNSYYFGNQVQTMAAILLMLLLVAAVLVSLQEEKRLRFHREILSSYLKKCVQLFSASAGPASVSKGK